MLIGDKNYYGTQFEASLAEVGITPVAPIAHG
jgi:hypothetical protein